MTQLFLDIFCEEIPARFQHKATEDAKRLLAAVLNKAGLKFGTIKSVVSPRHLGMSVEGVPATTQAVSSVRKGPRVDAPDAAIQGFLKSAGVTMAMCELEETPKGTFLVARLETPARATKDVLPPLLEEMILNFPWGQTMRWGTGTKGWVRPIHRLVALFDGDVLPMCLRFGETPDAPVVHASNITKGHRFMARDAFEVSSFEDYVIKLEKTLVLVDHDKRRIRIADALNTLALSKGLKLAHYPGLLEEVTGLVEWPVVYLGTIDRAFMDLPREILTTTMRVHQRYFPLENQDGFLAPVFAFVAATHTDDGGASVIQGNERVLRARLSDALFYYALDQKVSLETHALSLDKLVFHARLGTMAQKRDRLEALCGHVAELLGEDVSLAKQAGRLAKADLVTGVVHEFPELQGVMGSYYGKNQGVHPSICDALLSQYQPKGPEDNLPESKLAQILALCDRLDTLAGFFAVNVTPTGSGDPFALRRAALGIIRFLEKTHFNVSLGALLSAAYDLYAPIFESEQALSKDETISNLKVFFAERMKVLWSKDLRHDQIASVLNMEEPLWRAKAKGEALASFFAREEGPRLLASYRRGTNILRHEEEKETRVFMGCDAMSAHFVLPPETQLYEALLQVEHTCAARLKESDFQGAMAALVPLCAPIDTFLNDVIVNDLDPNLRKARLGLLARLRTCLSSVVDFSTLEEL